MTIKNYLLKLPSDIAAKAILNTATDRLDDEAGSICDALIQAFVWEHSPQGHDYWAAIYETYEADEISSDDSIVGFSLN